MSARHSPGATARGTIQDGGCSGKVPGSFDIFRPAQQLLNWGACGAAALRTSRSFTRPLKVGMVVVGTKNWYHVAMSRVPCLEQRKYQLVQTGSKTHRQIRK